MQFYFTYYFGVALLFYPWESQKLTRSLLKEIPVGTNMTHAKSIMEGRGFKCSQDSVKTIDKPLSYLFCGKCEKTADEKQYKRFEVEIHSDNEHIFLTDIQANVRQLPQCIVH